MSLDLSRVSASLARSRPSDTDAVTQALAQFVEDVLALHANDADGTALPSGRVATHFASEVTGRSDARARGAVMGAPARYAEVTLSGEDGQPITDRALPTVRRFSVFLYWGAGADRASGARQFRDLVGGASPLAPGLIPAITRQEVLDADGETVYCTAASLVRTGFYNPNALDQRADAAWRHEAELSITLEG